MSQRLKSSFNFRRKSGTNLSSRQSTAASPSPPPANNSSASLPMNNSPNHLGRPPSYTYNPGVRPTSPLPPGGQQLAHHPPPINTAVGGYPQQHVAPPPVAGQPPGYSGYPHPPPALNQQLQYGGRPQHGELDGGRSKAQLIVGIDFGTTFSGVAYAFATNTEAREDIITEWPGAGTHTKQKVR